jgi:hypothetical protein
MDRRFLRLVAMRTALGGVAAVALGLTAFAGRFEPSQGGRPPARSGDTAGVGERRLPERPRQQVDVTPVAVTGRTLRVPANGDLQAAIDAARPGDAIALEPGATYHGPFRLPRKDGDGWIVIAPRSERGLPPPNQRVTPPQAKAMSRIVAASGDAVIETDEGAHHYRLVGLEIAPADGVFLRALVQIGAHEKDAAVLPHHVVIDRCYLHGDPRKGTRRGVALNGRDNAVVNSYFADFKEVGADAQAIAGWNGAGPFKIANNYLEASGENVMFGGADPTIADLVPADIEVIGNHLSKPLRWKEGDPSFEGTAWTVKNLFELKNARRVLVDGNLMEYNWPHGQNGFAILFTVRNQDGGAPWSAIEDVTFVNNVVRHVAAGMNLLGRDDIHRSQPARRIAILNNVFLDVGGVWGKGRLFQLLDGVEDVIIEHNTAAHGDGIIWAGDRTAHRGFVFQNNIVMDNGAGILAEGTASGRPTLERYFPGGVVRGNAIVGGSADRYPPDNFFPASLQHIGFIGAQPSNVRLAASSPFKGAGTDKRDLGADVEALHPLAVGTAGSR